MDTTTVAGKTRIAHLSDAHVLDPRPSRTRSGWSMRTRFLSIGRPLDAVGRRRKLQRSLDMAKRVGAQHFVLSGDLTEIGAPGEYETLAEVLHDSGIAPSRLTLVPGNHDLYSSADAWRWALQGPLAAFAATSAGEPGKVVDVAGATLLPLDATFHQPVTRSAGCIPDEAFGGDRATRVGPDVPVSAAGSRPAPPALSSQDQRPALARRDGRRAPHDGDARGLPASVRASWSPARATVDRALGCGVSRIRGATVWWSTTRRRPPRARVRRAGRGGFEAAGLVVG